MHKLYISAALNIINKIFSKKTVEKYEKYKKMLEKIGNTYLIILNVLFRLFFVFVIIYANIELSNNIEDYITVHLNMKKSLILLFVNSNFIVNKNKVEKLAQLPK